MLRDLQLRNVQNPLGGGNLEIKINAKSQNTKLVWFWLFPLIFIPFIYAWLSNDRDQATKPTYSNVNLHAINPGETPLSATAEIQKSQSVANNPRETPSDKTPVRVPPPAPEHIAAIAAPDRQKIINNPIKHVQKPIAAQKIKSGTGASTKPIKIAKSRELAESLYQEAQGSVSLMMTKQLLKESLQIDPSYLPARVLLLQTLLKSHASASDLGDFIDKSIVLFPSNMMFIKARAHLFIQQKNYADAARLLENAAPKNLEDSHYLSLLAASYQQLGDYRQSARLYRQLTSLQPEKAENWLGLAMAKDKLNEIATAIQFYRMALEKRTLSIEVVDYIKQRLNALQ